MWFFLLLFFTVASIYSILNMSLASSGRTIVIGAVLLFVTSLVFYPFCIQIKGDTFVGLLHQPSIVSTVAFVQIFEAIGFIFLSVIHIKHHYLGQVKKRITSLTLLPSLVFLIGLFFLQTYTYVKIENTPFLLVAIVFSGGVALLFFTLVWLTQKIIKQWDLRAELKMLTALFQIVLAMFLPLIIKGVQVPFSNLVIEVEPIVVTVLIVLAFVIVGYAKHKLSEIIHKTKYPLLSTKK